VYITPKAAEKLNVGSPGQLKPNLNDPKASLREELQSIPDLIDLVNSAADDLGVDLERTPTAMDDVIFQNAPYESTPRYFVSDDPSVSFETTENRVAKEEPLAEDSWLQQTRRHLTKLSEAREQLMDELDSIAGDLDVRLQDQQEIESVNESAAQRALSKVPTGFSSKLTWLESKPIDRTDDDFPSIVDNNDEERRLRRALTRVFSQSKKPPSAIQKSYKAERFSPEEI
jgi:hypothetical protein